LGKIWIKKLKIWKNLDIKLYYFID